MSMEMDRLRAARPTPADTTDLVGPAEREALLVRITHTDRMTAGPERTAGDPGRTVSLSDRATAGSGRAGAPDGATGAPHRTVTGPGRATAAGRTAARPGRRGRPVGSSSSGASRRRVGLLALPTAAAGIAVVVAMAVAAGPPPSGDGGAPGVGAATGSAAGEGPAPGTVSYVLARARTALGDSRELVQHTVVRSFRGCAGERWTYLGSAAGPSRDRYRETCGGAPSQDIGTRLLPDRPGRAMSTYVKYFERTWSRGVIDVDPDPALTFGAESSPERLRQQLADGSWQIVGRQRLGARDTVHLRAVDLPGGPQPEIWVDAASFLVARTLVFKGGPGEWVPLRKDIDWRPATSAALADFEVPVPAGYTRTSG